MSKKHRRWLIFLKSFVFLFPTTLIAAFVLLFSVQFVFRGIVFGPNDSPIRVSFLYWGYDFREVLESPIIYLLSIALVSSLVGASWLAMITTKYPRYFVSQILVVPWISVILTSPLWGLIWSINRWPPENFSNFSTMMLFYRTDTGNGLSLGWLSAAQSYPLNILSYSVFCLLLLINKKLFLDKRESE